MQKMWLWREQKMCCWIECILFIDLSPFNVCQKQPCSVNNLLNALQVPVEQQKKKKIDNNNNKMWRSSLFLVCSFLLYSRAQTTFCIVTNTVWRWQVEEALHIICLVFFFSSLCLSFDGVTISIVKRFILSNDYNQRSHEH